MSQANKIKESDYTSTPLAISAAPAPIHLFQPPHDFLSWTGKFRRQTQSPLISLLKSRSSPWWGSAAGRSRGWPSGPQTRRLRNWDDQETYRTWRAGQVAPTLHTHHSYKQHHHLYWLLMLSGTGLGERGSSLTAILRGLYFLKTRKKNNTTLFSTSPCFLVTDNLKVWTLFQHPSPG